MDGQKWVTAAKLYLETQKRRDDIAKELELQNDAIREDVLDLFNESDKIATRVLKVGDIIIKVAKENPPTETRSTDFEAIVDALSEVSEELATKIEELKVQFTSVKPPAASKKPALRIDDSSISESIASVVSSKVKSFIASLKKWFTKIDTKIAKLEDMIATL